MTDSSVFARDPDLRIDLAQRRRALLVNSSIYSSRHLADAAALVRADRVAVAAAARLAAGLAASGDWSDVVSRDVRTLARALAAVARRPWGADRDRAAWHRDRLRELEAQAVRVGTLAQIVEALARRLPPGAAQPTKRALKRRITIVGR